MTKTLIRPAPVPRVRLVEKYQDSDAPDAIFLASSYDMAPDDWQEPILADWLARRKNGKWAHGRCGLAAPRQNGKNGVIEIRELFGMVVLGEAFLHTAHEVKTARKAFKRLKHFFGDTANDTKARYPELNALVAEVRNTNGQEAIFLKDLYEVDGKLVRSSGAPRAGARFVARGGSVEIVARSNGSGRGFTVDVLVLDEAQHLDDDELEAIRSAVSSAPLGNPQVIYTGTPPNREKGELGEVWLRVRGLAAKKTKRLSWTEYGAPDGPLPDIDDVALLFATNPALELQHANGAYGLQMDTVNDERGELSPEGYARERYGWWGNKGGGGGVIAMTQWVALRVRATPPTKAQIVVHTSPDLDWTTVATASAGPDGRTLVLVDHQEGTAHVIEAIAALRENLDEVVELALTPTAAPLFGPKLTKAKVKHEVLTRVEVGRGCTAFQEMVRTGAMAHVGQQVLDDAARRSSTRMLSNTQQWLDQGSPLVAASTAAQRWAMNTAAPSTPPPKPRRASRPAVTSSGFNADTAGF